MAAISSKKFRSGLLLNVLHTSESQRTEAQENNLSSIADYSWTKGPTNGLNSKFRWQETANGKLIAHCEIEEE
ncbi:hypothetical protein [Candidatus Chlorohelix sp.]|uniref:hypothetical protein n=1 Tax=Candidatus Chlorohelix sp. TaxID=3139201 RepID=UPI003062B450